MIASLKKWLIILKLLLVIIILVPQLAIAQPAPPLPPIVYTPPEIEEGEYTDFSELTPPPRPAVWCNCYAYLKQTYVPDLPPTAVILANLKRSGKVAVFYYADVGLHHYAYVVSDQGNSILIDEANYYSCKQGHRVVAKNDPSFLGFY